MVTARTLREHLGVIDTLRHQVASHADTGDETAFERAASLLVAVAELAEVVEAEGIDLMPDETDTEYAALVARAVEVLAVRHG